MWHPRISAFIAATVLILATSVHGQIINGLMGINGGGKQAGQINLPYIANDGAGNTWFIYNDGALRQQMGQPVYGQAGMLTIDGANFNTLNNQGKIDDKTGELILENPQMDGLAVTRRIFFDKENACVRYVDVLHNPDHQDHTVNVGLQTNFNFGVQQSQLVPDPRHKDQNLAWAGVTGVGRAVLEVYAGSGGKAMPVINYQMGSPIVVATYSVTVPAGKDAAIMHLHLFVPSMEAGTKFTNDLQPAKLLRNLPPDLSKQIVNFSVGIGWLSNLEILRGDVFDVVELRGGDRYKGTLRETSYQLNTFYGAITLPPEHVVAMINVGQFRPRQLLVTENGEMFGGYLVKPTIDIALTSGQMISIPLDQISRLGYRKRPDEPQEITPDKPMVLMRGGDRVDVLPPADKIVVSTCYGSVALDPAAVAAIVFQTEESGVHDIYMNDGSKFAGLVSAGELEMKLAGGGSEQTVQFPVSDMIRLQLAAKMPETDGDSPSLSLINQDLLCGSLEGQIKLTTAFDTIALEGSQIRRIVRGSDTTGDVQVTSWDGSTISGQIAEPAVACRLLSGVALNVPSSLLKEYNQPHPQPSADMVAQIQATAADLSADDWRERDRAEAALTSMGPAVIGVLRDLRPKAMPEAQQRIDAIIKNLEAAAAKPAGGNAGN